MDGKQFDDLAKTLANATSRRSFLKTLAGGGAGGLAVLLGRKQAAAVICRAPGVLCAKDAQCCSGQCGHDNRCACPDGGLFCHRDCLDGTSDLNNCGSCDNVCATDVPYAHPICSDSNCGSECDVRTCDDNSCAPADGCCLDSECADLTDECHQGQCQEHHCVAQVMEGQTCGTGPTCIDSTTVKAQDTCDQTGQCKEGATTACTTDIANAHPVCTDSECGYACDGSPCGDACCPTGTSCADSATELCCASGVACSGQCCANASDVCNADNQCCARPPLDQLCTSNGKQLCGGLSESTCGTTFTCPDCTAPDTCHSNICSCTATSCAAQHYDCGSIDNNCGVTLDCGTCPLGGQTCGYDVPHHCGGGCSSTCGENEICGMGMDSNGILHTACCLPPGTPALDSNCSGCCLFPCSRSANGYALACDVNNICLGSVPGYC